MNSEMKSAVKEITKDMIIEKMVCVAGYEESCQVSDDYMDSASEAFSSVDFLIRSVLEKLLPPLLKSTTFSYETSGHTDWDGDRRYTTFVQIRFYRNEPFVKEDELNLQYSIKSDTYAELAEMLYEDLQDFANAAVSDTVHLRMDEVVSVAQILPEVTQEEVDQIRQIIDDWQFAQKAVKLIYEDIKKAS